MVMLTVNVLCVYLGITTSYHSNGIMEVCVRIVAKHPRTAEAILPEFLISQLSVYSLSEKEVAAAT